jgi:cell division protein FtsB
MNFVAVLVAIAVIIVLFWIGRELLCWYWKINESLAALNEIRTLMQRSVKAQERMADLMEASQSVGGTGTRANSEPALPTMFANN